jgi:hypothetical protein
MNKLACQVTGLITAITPRCATDDGCTIQVIMPRTAMFGDREAVAADPPTASLGGKKQFSKYLAKRIQAVPHTT